MKYLKVFVDFRQSMASLSYAERGRLFTAMLDYADKGTTEEISGNERFVFDAAMVEIDRQRAAYNNKVKAAQKATEARSIMNDIAENATFRNDIVDKRNNIVQDKDEDKDEDKDTHINSVGAEQAAPSFILTDGSVYKLTEEQVTQLVNEFPMLDCFAVLADIRRWCEANPRQRKTRAGAARFINAWFVRERDKRQQWREQAIVRNKPQKKERSHKYDEIYDRY